MTEYRNPTPCVDIVIPDGRGYIAVIKRKNPPFGWALPGGFVDEGESTEEAAVREAKEELGVDITIVHLLGVYSDPKRDPRQHNMTCVYVAAPVDERRVVAGDDAAEVSWIGYRYARSSHYKLVFDHEQIVDDFSRWDATMHMGDLYTPFMAQIAKGHHTFQAYMDIEPTVEQIHGCMSRISALLRNNEIQQTLAKGQDRIHMNFSARTVYYVIDKMGLNRHVEVKPDDPGSSWMVIL